MGSNLGRKSIAKIFVAIYFAIKKWHMCHFFILILILVENLVFDNSTLIFNYLHHS